MKPRYFIAVLISVCSQLCSLANNIQVTNVSFTGQNTTLHTVQVQFSLSWENSWRVTAGPGNWDAAWVFVKYRVGGGPWLHASLWNANFVAPPGSTIVIASANPAAPFNIGSNPGAGAFIYRSANGSGTFTVNNAQLQWNYGISGLTDNDVVDVQVFAIEHVYVPQNSFYVGDGLQNAGNQYSLTFINTANATTAASGTGQPGGFPFGQLAPANATWPNGYSAFYCMKYEVSQQGYVDFLNSLTREQQANHVASPVGSGVTSVTNRYVMTNSTTMDSRTGIRCDATISGSGPLSFYCDYDGDGTGGESTDGKDIACLLSIADLFAYLDWTGLRPLTDLEFEKCGRGTLAPVPGEYAWGNATIIPATSILNPGLSNEEPNVSANVVSYLNPVLGPVRVGSVAGIGTNREQAGAGYYGIMELSGNMYERVINLSSAPDRTYVGSHGNGSLDVAGNFTNSDWPPSVSQTVFSIRGGSYFTIASDMTLSTRTFPVGSPAGRFPAWGGRGCRTAP